MNDMIKDVYVVNSENVYYWFQTKESAEKWIIECEKNGDQKDIRFTYSKCEIDKEDNNVFEELAVLQVFRP